MGGLFSFDKNQEVFPLEDPAASGSEKDFEVTFNGSPAGVTATASHHPGAACITEAAVPTGQEDVGTLTRVADATRDSGGEGLASAKLP
jgi:hypothetical protein